MVALLVVAPAIGAGAVAPGSPAAANALPPRAVDGAATAAPTTANGTDVTLSFEEIPGVGETADGMALHRQYEDAYGLTFVPNDSTVDHGAVVARCSSGDPTCERAHAGESVVTGVGDDEFSAHPITIRFEEPQTVVSLYAKHKPTDDDFTGVATMTARDAEGNRLDTARVTFDTGTGWHRLEVGNEFGSANIAEVTVAGGQDGVFPYDNAIVVDSLSFDAPESGLPLADRTPPSVELRSPESGAVVTYETARVGVDLGFRVRDGNQLQNVSVRVDDGSYRTICGSGARSCPSGDSAYDTADLSYDVTTALPTADGSYDVTLRGCDLAGNCATDRTSVTVAVPDPVRIDRIDDRDAAEPVVLRTDPRKTAPGGTVTLHGAFHGRTTVALFGGCSEFPDTCDFRTEVPDSKVSIAPDGSTMTVRIPEIPEPHDRRSLFVGVFDHVDGDGIETTADGWARSDEFELGEPPYPSTYGFQFDNRNGLSGWKPLQGTYGKNAYACGPGGGFCVPRVLYAAVWLPVYRVWMQKSSGSCVGMAATSLLAYQDGESFQMLGQPADLEAGDLHEDANYPAGIPGNGAATSRVPPWKDRKGTQHFRTGDRPRTLFPRRAATTWGVVRANHGVQTSWEFMEVFLTERLERLQPSPTDTLREIRGNPTDYVLCMKEDNGGHCVSPYAVQAVNSTTSRILVYDNNFPEDNAFVDTDGDNKSDAWRYRGPRFVEVDTEEDTFRFPRNAPTDPSDPNYADWNASHSFLYAVPTSVWEQGRHAPVDVAVADEVADASTIISFNLVFGGADATYRTDGGRWGWQRDGTFVDTLPSATPVSPLGQPAADNRVVPLVVRGDAGAPAAQVNVRGDDYTYHTSRPGRAFLLSVDDATAGETDEVVPSSGSEGLRSVSLSPEGERTVTATVGMGFDADSEAVVSLAGVDVTGSGTAGFEALPDRRGVQFHNDDGEASTHSLVVQSVTVVDGEPVNRTVVYGPFEVPAGATQTVTLAGWPDDPEIRSEIDADGDGEADRVETLSGTQCDAGPAADADGDGVPDSCLPADGGTGGDGDGDSDGSGDDDGPVGGMGPLGGLPVPAFVPELLARNLQPALVAAVLVAVVAWLWRR